MPSFTQILSLAAIAAVAQAITVTKPTKHQLWDSAKSNVVSWESVSTDPQVVDIYLSHLAAQPPTNDLLFSSVDISKGSVTVEGLQLPNGEAYQINLVAHNKPEQIYAQSQQFNVTGEAVKATSTLDGYTGPTHTSTSDNESNESTKTSTKATTLSTSTSTSTRNSTSTGTSSSAESTSDSESSASSEATPTSSSSTTGASTTPSATRNAAITNMASSGSLVAVLFGAMALFI